MIFDKLISVTMWLFTESLDKIKMYTKKIFENKVIFKHKNDFIKWPPRSNIIPGKLIAVIYLSFIESLSEIKI